MINLTCARNGFFIAAELDLDGKPTGVVLVIDSNGHVVHIAASFKEALAWTDGQDDAPETPDYPRARG